MSIYPHIPCPCVCIQPSSSHLLPSDMRHNSCCMPPCIHAPPAAIFHLLEPYRILLEIFMDVNSMFPLGSKNKQPATSPQREHGIYIHKYFKEDSIWLKQMKNLWM